MDIFTVLPKEIQQRVRLYFCSPTADCVRFFIENRESKQSIFPLLRHIDDFVYSHKLAIDDFDYFLINHWNWWHGKNEYIQEIYEIWDFYVGRLGTEIQKGTLKSEALYLDR